jgi:DNA-binding NarL/FixJ family response regulator
MTADLTPEKAAARCSRLQPRLREVLTLAAAKGMRHHEIADELGIGRRIVHKYVSRLCDALAAKSLTHAAYIATKGGLL